MWHTDLAGAKPRTAAAASALAMMTGNRIRSSSNMCDVISSATSANVESASRDSGWRSPCTDADELGPPCGAEGTCPFSGAGPAACPAIDGLIVEL